MTRVHVLESVRRHSGLGIRFWDQATGSTVVEGLDVTLFPRSNRQARTALLPNQGGVYVAHNAPGFRDFEFSNQPPAELWATPTRPYRIEVSDPAGRFLPSGFDVDLPVRGLLSLMAPWLSPAQAIPLLLETDSPPRPVPGVVPLFSAPARPLPEPLGVVYAQLRLRNNGAAVPWALLAVAIDGNQRGLGLADADGRVAVFFGYPDPPRRQLSSPPEQRNDFSWTVSLTAFRDDDLPATEPPDLALLLSQLSQPRQVLESLHSPALPLRLDYRVPLTARTAGATGEEASCLLLAA
jgi:hypothetical protein